MLITAGNAFFPTSDVVPRPGEVRARIEGDLACILDGIRRMGRRTDAVVMSGSLGRGEGTVILQDGAPCLLSDYDLCVFSSQIPDHTFYRTLASELSGRLWGPQVSIGAVPTSQLHTISPCVWGYDLKYGTTVLEGDPTLLEAIPYYGPADIPIWEGLKLLFNYAAYLLAAPCLLDATAAPAAEAVELRLSIIRAAYRLGDALTVLEGRYHPSLAVRQASLPALPPFRDLPAGDQEVILWGCEEKLRPGQFWTFDPIGKLARLLSLIETILTRYLCRFLQVNDGTLPALLDTYRQRHPGQRPPWSTWRGLRARLWRDGPADLPRTAVPADPYHFILSLVPLVLLSLPGLLHRPAYLEAASQLLAVDAAAAGTLSADDQWWNVRERTVRLWKEYCSRG